MVHSKMLLLDWQDGQLGKVLTMPETAHVLSESIDSPRLFQAKPFYLHPGPSNSTLLGKSCLTPLRSKTHSVLKSIVLWYPCVLLLTWLMQQTQENRCRSKSPFATQNSLFSVSFDVCEKGYDTQGCSVMMVLEAGSKNDQLII